jgi:predicted transcriptional regulator
MTRTYTAKRLLEHGPLTWRELLEITGWRESVLKGAIQNLIDTELVVAEKASARRNVYRLAS